MSGKQTFRPGPWASEVSYKTLAQMAERTFFRFGSSAEQRQAMHSAVRCMELVPVLVKALEAIEWSAECCYMPACRFCSGHKDSSHESNCIIGNALKMARGE